MRDLVFNLGFGTLLTHELDSMINHEWHVIPVIRSLSEEAGMTIFIVAHLPIIAALIALVSSRNSKIRELARLGISIFLVIHGLLHILFSTHPAYEFSNLLSNLLIFGGSVLGFVYLILAWNVRSRSAT